MSSITVALVDDHELVRDGIVAWLAEHASQIRITDSVPSVAALRAGPGWGCDVVMLDLNLSDDSTVEENLAALTDAGSRVVVVSENKTSEMARRAMRAGAYGYVPKSATAAEMAEAVVEVDRGGTYMGRALALALLAEPELTRPALSAQELTALRLYAGGMPMKSVARRMRISEGSVKSYVDRIREKYARAGRDAPTKVDLYRRAVEDGHLPLV